jgi:hypothetical protein
MTVKRNGNIMDNSVVIPRNISDKISYQYLGIFVTRLVIGI